MSRRARRVKKSSKAKARVITKRTGISEARSLAAADLITVHATLLRHPIRRPAKRVVRVADSLYEEIP